MTYPPPSSHSAPAAQLHIPPPRPPELQIQLPSRCPCPSFLLLILDKFYVILWYDRVLLQQKLLNLLTHIALHYDLLASTWDFRYG